MTGGSMSTIYETSHADFPAVYAVRVQREGDPRWLQCVQRVCHTAGRNTTAPLHRPVLIGLNTQPALSTHACRITTPPFPLTALTRTSLAYALQASELRRQNEATCERLLEEGQAAHQPLAVPTQYAASFG